MGDMPRFSLKRLLLSTFLIAAGVAYIGNAVVHGDEGPGWGVALPVSLWIGSGACVTAGAFNLFRRPWLGALIGGVAAAAFLAWAWASMNL
jgi:hypothetical protein